MDQQQSQVKSYYSGWAELPQCQRSTVNPENLQRSRVSEQQRTGDSSSKFVMFCLITVYRTMKQQHAHSITGKMRVGCYI